MKPLPKDEFAEKYEKLTDKWFSLEVQKPERTLSGKTVFTTARLQVGILPDNTLIAREV